MASTAIQPPGEHTDQPAPLQGPTRTSDRLTPLPHLRKWFLALCLAMTLIATVLPSPARADDDEPFVYDARVQGYTKTVQLSSSSTALTWLLLIVLAGACIGVMFIDAKRSHLD